MDKRRRLACLKQTVCSGVQGHPGSIGAFWGKNRGEVGLCDSGGITESSLLPLPLVLSCGMSILGSLTFFRATNSFSAVALSATSSSYLGTKSTGSVAKTSIGWYLKREKEN